MPATQIHRPYRVKSTLGDDVLLLESFEGVESVSTPFRFTLRVLAQNPNIDMKGLMRTPMVISIVLSDKTERHIHGNVSRMKQLEYGDDGLAAYEIELVSWLWFSNLFVDCRAFQDMKAPDIIQKVFQDRGFTDFKLSLTGSYQSREYCVQYRESDFNFVSRLMEEEGIYYYFEQTVDKHTMVLVDTIGNLEACPSDASPAYSPSTGGRLTEDTVLTLEAENQVVITHSALTDYDFQKPSTQLYSASAGNQVGEFYDYPGRYLTKGDAELLSRIRLEEREARQSIVRGTSNCMGFQNGYKFTLKDHYRDDANQEYMLLSVTHWGRNSSYRSAEDEGFEYNNRFEAAPTAIPFRPPRLARKPVIEGQQTAVVVGKAGEEIWTDQYGRVKVQFFWDRLGNADEKSSCWMRVAQSWAGKMWGAIYTPRIGQEVIVSFLEGDPDRPIITGRVYNADQMPPYPLPDNQTRSTLKSMSSKGQNGFNELRFEDKAGSEQIFIHGEKDLDIKIKNDRKENIDNDRHLSVKNDKFEKITGNEHSHIVGNQNEAIDGNHSLAIKGNQGITVTGNQSLSVTGNMAESVTGNQSLQVTQNVYIKGMQVVIEAEVGLTIKMGPNFITLDPSGIAISGMPMVQINSAGSALSGSPQQAVTVTAPTDPKDADDDKPGGTTSPLSPNPKTPLKMSLETISPTTKPPDEVEEPDRPVPLAAPSGANSAPADVATFPKDVDPVAVAQVLQDASKDGAPLCLE